MGEKMIMVDIHNHYYPKVYMDFLIKQKNAPKVFEQKGKIFFAAHPDTSLAIPTSESFYNIDLRISEMNKIGVDQIGLTLGNPWTDFLDPKHSSKLAKQVNDSIAEAVAKYPEKIFGIATVPLRDRENYLEELDRAITNLDLRGVSVGTNINGTYLDSPEFKPFFQRVEQLGVPIFMHPTTPTNYQRMKNHNLIPMIGFPSETSIAVGKLIFSGILDEFPSLKIVLSHAGGTLPYLVGRLDVMGGRFAKRKPSEYLKKIYYDCISYSTPALKCVYSLVGAEHLLFGTDYPYLADNAILMKNLEELNLSEKEKKLIYYENAWKLLGKT